MTNQLLLTTESSEWLHTQLRLCAGVIEVVVSYFIPKGMLQKVICFYLKDHLSCQTFRHLLQAISLAFDPRFLNHRLLCPLPTGIISLSF